MKDIVLWKTDSYSFLTTTVKLLRNFYVTNWPPFGFSKWKVCRKWKDTSAEKMFAHTINKYKGIHYFVTLSISDRVI